MGDPLIVAPALSVVVDELAKRPSWQHAHPLAVPIELFAAAKDEMKAIMKKRGFPLAVSREVRGDNFLIYGSVIVSNG